MVTLLRQLPAASGQYSGDYHVCPVLFTTRALLAGPTSPDRPRLLTSRSQPWAAINTGQRRRRPAAAGVTRLQRSVVEACGNTREAIEGRGLLTACQPVKPW